jgi:hypothetical protein
MDKQMLWQSWIQLKKNKMQIGGEDIENLLLSMVLRKKYF